MATIVGQLEAILRLDDQMTGQLQKSVGGLSKLGNVVSTGAGFLLAQGVGAAVNAVGDLVGTGLDFEAQMANVNSIAQLSATELQNLSDQVLDLTSNPAIVQGPANLAEGLYNIQSSGFEGAAAMDVLEQSALAATAGMTTTDTAARAIAGTMNAYGQETYSAAQIADVFFKVVDSGVISFEELANNLGDTTSLAANLGVGVEQLGAAYATLTLNNVNASAAETQIASLMRAAINPTTALTEAVQAYGYETAESLIKAEGLPGFLKVLTDASGGSAESLAEMLGSAEAANAALILGGKGAQTYADALEDMTEQLNDGGAMQRALEKQMQSSAYQSAKLKQQVTVLATVGFGMLAPFISRGLTQLTRFVGNGLVPFGRYLSLVIRDGDTLNDFLTHLPQPLRRTAHAFGVVVEAVSDVVRAFGDRGLRGAIRTLTEGGELAQIGSALSALGQEAWNAAVSGIQAMPWGTLWDLVTEAVPQVVPLLFDILPAIGTWLWDTGNDLASWAIGHLPGTATRGDGTEGPAGTNAASTVDVLLDLAAQLGEWIWGTGTDFASWAKGTIEETVSIDNIKAVLNVTADTLEMAWGGFSDAGSWVYSKIEKAITIEDITAALSVAADTLTMLWGGFEDAASWVYSKITKVVNVSNLSAALEFVADLAGDLWGEFTDAAAWLKNEIDPAGTGVTVDKITAYISGEIKAGTGFDVGAVVTFIEDLWTVDSATETALRSSGEDIGEKVGTWIIDGITSFFGGGEEENQAVAYADMIAGMFPAEPSGTLITALDQFAYGLIDGLWNAIEAAWGPFIADWANKILDIYNTLADAANLIPGVDLPKYKVEIDSEGNVALVRENGAEMGNAMADAMNEAFNAAYTAQLLSSLADSGLSSTDMNTLLDIEAQAQSTGAAISIATDEMQQLIELAANLDFATSGGTINPAGGMTQEEIEQQGESERRFKFTADTADFDRALGNIETKLAGFARTSPPLQLPEPDTSRITRALDSIQSKVKDSSGLGKMEIDADNGPALAAFDVVTKAAVAWNGLTSTSDIAGDNALFIDALSTATIGAVAWDAATFTADLAGNADPFMTAAAASFDMGRAFDGTVFSATFSADVSPLEGALVRVRQIAQEISDLLPNSPAKKGPLARPVSFGYVADSLIATMGEMPSIAERGMAGVSAAFERAGGVAASLYTEQGNAARGKAGGGFRNYGNYYESDRYWAPEQTMMARGIQRGRG